MLNDQLIDQLGLVVMAINDFPPQKCHELEIEKKKNKKKINFQKKNCLLRCIMNSSKLLHITNNLIIF